MPSQLMTLERFTGLAASGESETLECKETTWRYFEAAIKVCAFRSEPWANYLR